MDKRLNVRRVYVDSRMRISGTGSDFEVELPEAIEVPRGTKAYVSQFLCTHSFETVHEHNNRLYVAENAASSFRARIVTVPPGPYDADSLRLALETALNTNRLAGMGSYAVQRSVSAGPSSTSTAGSAYRFFTITVSGGQFRILSDDFLRSGAGPISWSLWLGPDYEQNDLRSLSELFTFPRHDDFSSSAVSGLLDLRSRHTLFLHSQSFGSTSSICPLGTRSIICRIPVLSSYGGIIVYENPGHPADYLEVTGSMLQRLRFRLADTYNRTIDLRGGSCSFTILLSDD